MNSFLGPGLRPEKRDVERLTGILVKTGKRVLDLKMTRWGVFEGVSSRFIDRCPAYYSLFNHTLRVNTEYQFISLDHVAVSVAHELIHAKQHEEQRLLLKDDWIYWNGKKHTHINETRKLDREEYEALPWEQEAISKEKELAIRVALSIEIYRDDSLCNGG